MIQKQSILRLCLFLMVMGIAISSEMAFTEVPSNPLIDYPGFLTVSQEVYELRKKRRIDVATFQKMSQEENTLILDTRSQAMYNQKHLKGAKHLNFSDFSEEKLAQVIPSKATRILIYCNNNFQNNSEAFVTKMAPLALNIPTFINLYGYGYHNVYELGPAVNEEDTQLEFESQS